MARASVFESAQLGKETTHGTAVPADKFIESLGIGDPSPQGAYSGFRPEGSKFNTMIRKGKEYTTLSYTQALDYAWIIYPLSGMFGEPTPTQPDSTNAPNAYQWQFKPSTGPDTPTTFTIEKGSSSRAAQFVYAVFASLGFTIDANSEDSSVTGSIIAQKIEDGITMTASPTTIDGVPILPEHWAVYIADTQSALDSATALDEVLSVEFSYGEKFSPEFTVARDSTFASVVEKYADIGGTLSMEANADAMAYLTTLRDLDEKWLRLEAQGASLGGTVYYLFQIDIPIYFAALPSFGDSNDVYAANFAYIARKDSSLNSAVQFTVVNEISAL